MHMIPYFGGKSYTARWIISHFPQDYKQLTYCEVFGGGG
ncbi:MAG: DNA adenine methylase [Ignavibacteriaceae bacterium]